MRIASEHARSLSRIGGPIAAMLLLCFTLWPALNRPVQADERAGSPLPLVYASPLEILLSPDGARLYVLCQQTEEVRVLDAVAYAQLGFPCGRIPRGMALSANWRAALCHQFLGRYAFGYRYAALAVIATWNVGAEPSGVVEDRPENRFLLPTAFQTTLLCSMREPALKRSG